MVEPIRREVLDGEGIYLNTHYNYFPYEYLWRSTKYLILVLFCLKIGRSAWGEAVGREGDACVLMASKMLMADDTLPLRSSSTFLVINSNKVVMIIRELF
jgi:hypothetical protein